MRKALGRFVVVVFAASPLVAGIVSPSWADAATRCTTSTSRDGTLGVCPGAAAVGAVVKVRGNSYCGGSHPAGACRVAFTVISTAMPRLRAEPTTVTAGSRLTLVGSRFKARELVKLYVGPPRAGADFWGSKRADGTGGFRKTFEINPSVGAGDWVVIACQGSCRVKASASFKTKPASTSASRLVGIRAAHHPGYDRIVFQFSGAVPSRRNLRYVSRLVADPSGRTVAIAGRAVLEANFFRATARNLVGRLTAPERIAFALPNVMSAVQAGDFESVLSYGIGLAKRTSFHVFTLTNPSRVVIDIGSP